MGEGLSGYRLVSAAAARGAIAKAFLLQRDDDRRLGDVTLKEHQLEAVARIRSAMHEFGGALLADPVGTGKTYVGLALADQGSETIVVGPAALREMWRDAALTCSRPVRFISFEALSRSPVSSESCSLVIVDEAHHARNPATIRFGNLARLVATRRTLLLSATPIHNRRKDLVALLRLFMGSRAETLNDAELARVVVRRASLRKVIRGFPRTPDLVWWDLPEDDRVPLVLLDLPPPLPPADGGDGGALVVHSLIRQWISSESALTGGLRRRLVRAEGLIAALEDGTWPSKAELSSWISGDDTVQLGFAGLLAGSDSRSHELLQIVTSHRDGLFDALRLARAGVSDAARADRIRQLRREYPDRKIVAFSQYADTIDGMFKRLASDGGTAALTGSGAIVTGGSLSRNDVLDCFAPRARRASAPRRAKEVTLLLTTDLLSEGVNLQDAGVVVHFDFPWTPARMEQRVGRVARIGSAHDDVLTFAFRPPGSAAAIVRIEEILKRKMREAGVVTESMPALNIWSEPAAQQNPSSYNESIRRLIRTWETDEVVPMSVCVVARAQSQTKGFVALIEWGNDMRLIGCVDDRISDDPALVAECVRHCGGPDLKCDMAEAEDVHRKVQNWIAGSAALAPAAGSHAGRSPPRIKLLRHIDRIVRQTRMELRPAIAQRAEVARSLLLGATDEQGERELAALDPLDVGIIERVIDTVEKTSRALTSQPVVLRVLLFFGK